MPRSATFCRHSAQLDVSWQRHAVHRFWFRLYRFLSYLPTASFVISWLHDARQPIQSSKGHGGSQLEDFSVTGEECDLLTRAINAICDSGIHEVHSVVAGATLGGEWIPDVLGSREFWFVVVFVRIDIQKKAVSENNVLPSDADLGDAVDIQGLWYCCLRLGCVRSDSGVSWIAALGPRLGEQGQLTHRL